MPRRACASLPAQEGRTRAQQQQQQQPPRSSPPGPRSCPGLTPSSRGHRGAVLPSKKKIIPTSRVQHPPNLAGTGAPPGHHSKVRWCGAHRGSPHQKPSLPRSVRIRPPKPRCSVWGCVCSCGGASGGTGPGTARGDPPGSDTGTAGLTGRLTSGAFKSPPKSPCPEQQHPSGSTQDPRDRANPKAAARTP